MGQPLFEPLHINTGTHLIGLILDPTRPHHSYSPVQPPPKRKFPTCGVLTVGTRHFPTRHTSAEPIPALSIPSAQTTFINTALLRHCCDSRLGCDGLSIPSATVFPEVSVLSCSVGYKLYPFQSVSVKRKPSVVSFRLVSTVICVNKICIKTF